MDSAFPTSVALTHAPEEQPVALQGWLLVLARSAWVLISMTAVAVFVASLAPFYRATRDFTGAHEHGGTALRAGLAQIHFPVTWYAATNAVTAAVMVAVFVAVGVLLFWRKSTDPAALFFSLTLVTFGVIWPNTLDDLARVHPLFDLPDKALNAFGFAAFFLLFYLFPDGRFVPRWTKPLAVGWVVIQTVAAFVPDSMGAGSHTAAITFTLLEAGFPLTMFYAQIHRYRKESTPTQRQQIKWVTFSLVMALATFILVGLLGALPVFNRPGAAVALYDLGSGAAYGFGFMLVPIAIGFAVLRYRLWDIDPIVNHTLVYGALTFCIVAMYVVIVAELGVIFSTGENLFFSLIATGLIAVLFQPLRLWLQRGVNRLMYGERDDPYAVLNELGQRLEGTLAPESVLPTIVQSVTEALKLPYAAIALQRGDEFFPAAESGLVPRAEEGLLRLPLSYQHEVVGEFRLAPRATGEPFSTADLRLLDGLARQAGIAVRAVGLTLELQQARERLVSAREEERRRLRRDLHDGLGSQLVGLNLQIGIARQMVRGDPDAAEEKLQALRGEMRDAIGSVRQIAHNLRPPVLDDLGLREALLARVRQHSSASLTVDLEMPDEFPALSAAVEVAIYRIVEEALTNVVRHARARHCRVRLDAQREVELTIADDGVGLPELRRPGVGLLSMRERAEELGGSCRFATTDDGGTRITVRLPRMVN